MLFHGRPLVCALAFVWRRLLFRTTFVAITGSLGKTTAKQCVAACLAARYRTACIPVDSNDDGWLALSVLRVRPWHRYAVLEVAAGAPGRMAGRIPFVRPDVSIVLGIARTHTATYPTLAARAAEKGRLIGALRPGGLAVLNADDPLVAAMAPPVGAAMVRFGTRADADVRGAAIAARWPERFSLRVSCDGVNETVRTRLVGEHWMPVILAALAVARHAGVPLGEAAAALGRVPPVLGRLEPVQLPGGATVLRDDFIGSVDTLDAAVAVLEGAIVRRRIPPRDGLLRFRQGPEEPAPPPRARGRPLVGRGDLRRRERRLRRPACRGGGHGARAGPALPHARGDRAFPEIGARRGRPLAAQGPHGGPCDAHLPRAPRLDPLLEDRLPSPHPMRPLLGARGSSRKSE